MSKTDSTTAANPSFAAWLWETISTLLTVGVVVLVVRTLVFQPFNIPSGSMVPTLLVGDYVFVSKFSYGYSRYSFPFFNPPFSGRVFGALPARGDVAVFREPSNPSIDFIKRIIGLPGDRIQVKNGLLFVNGTPVVRQPAPTFVDEVFDPDENFQGYLPTRQFLETLPGGRTHPILQRVDDGIVDNTAVFVVPPDHLFAMGDNRDNSEDSRFLSAVGYIPVENLVGRAEFRFFSFDPIVPWWAVWEWPFAIRYSRLFTPVI